MGDAETAYRETEATAAKEKMCVLRETASRRTHFCFVGENSENGAGDR